MLTDRRKPLADIIQIALGPSIFTVYQAFLSWHCPMLAEACRSYRGGPVLLPKILQDVDVDVFGLFVQWSYTQSLLYEKGQPAYQQRLLGLGVFAKRLRIPKLQNDAIEMLEARRKVDNGRIQAKAFDYVYKNTVKGDELRRYTVDVCLSSTFSDETSRLFPPELEKEIFNADLIKREEGEEGRGLAKGMEKYHATEEDSQLR